MKTAAEIAMEKDTGYVPHGLSRENLIYVIIGKGLTTYKQLDDATIRKYGTYSEQFGWQWNDLSKVSDAELELLYWRLQ